MKREGIFRFANENPICYLATIENDRPHVRIMKLWYADKTGFYFEVLSPKDLCKQIDNAKDLTKGHEMRISGDIEFVTDAAIINKARKECEYLEDLGGQPVDSYVEVFKLAHGDAKIWKLKTNILQENVDVLIIWYELLCIMWVLLRTKLALYV